MQDMTTKKQQSNPFSTGAGGATFETRVQAAFVALMLTGQAAPCLPPWPINKIKLQGSYAHFNTDDMIVFIEDHKSDRKAKLIAQIKHKIKILVSEKDTTFRDVINSAWADFSNPEIFTNDNDAIALITGPLTTVDTDSVRPLLEWARHSEDEKDFFSKVNTGKFCSDDKRAKLEAFRVQLRNANDGIELTEYQLWDFLRHFFLLGFNLDSETGTDQILLQSLIAQSSKKDPVDLWARLVICVQSYDQDAGTLTIESLPQDIRDSFDTEFNPNWKLDISKLKVHGSYIFDGIKSDIGELYIERKEELIQLIDYGEKAEFVIVTGERGCGKSSLIKKYAEHLDSSYPTFFLRAEDLDKPHLDNVFSEIGLVSSLDEIEIGFALIPKKYLFIESLEKVLEFKSFNAFRDLLQFISKRPGWTVIASCRDYAIQQIIFNHIRQWNINYSTILINGFNDEQLQTLFDDIEILRPLETNPEITRLIRNPFFAEFAYRLAKGSVNFSDDDGEKEFKKAVWEEIISKESVRTDGMPPRRRKTFIDIAERRAKEMVYGVPELDFDSDAVLKLEEENLVHRDTSRGLVSLAHDVLEDWALEQYIENKYRSFPESILNFVSAIGHQPAMSRAFRIWLQQKLRDGEPIENLIMAILADEEIPSNWKDETFTAILLSDDPYAFLARLGDSLFENDNALLKRFCFILRVSCKIPNQELAKEISKNLPSAGSNYLILQPHGVGWDAVIRFLFENRENITEDLLPHLSAILIEWSETIHVDKELPEIGREAGLLSIQLLDFIKDSHRDKETRKKLLRVIIRCNPAIVNEFEDLLKTDIFDKTKRGRLYYIEDLLKLALTSPETAFLCKSVPDTVIKLAWHVWLTKSKDDDPYRGGRSDSVEESFGLEEYGSGSHFTSPSGIAGPFWFLLKYQPPRGLDFILKLVNYAADKYAHSDLDAHTSGTWNIIDTEKKVIDIQLNDGTIIQQHCSGRLWGAYRGSITVAPYLIQSALMALENWLIALADTPSMEKIVVFIFDKILRESNSVMTTAVLASIAVGFPDKVGDAAFPLLRTAEFYELDMLRFVSEQRKTDILGVNLLPQIDPVGEYYAEERRTAALKPWRKEHLETLITRLQFGKRKDEVFSILDDLRANCPKDDNWRIRFYRIDLRMSRPVVDEEKGIITFVPEKIEPDLEEIQQITQREYQGQIRYMNLFVWTEKTWEGEPVDGLYKQWSDVLTEAKDLLILLKTDDAPKAGRHYYEAIVKTAAIMLRDHSKEIDRDDIEWCIDLVIRSILEDKEIDNIPSLPFRRITSGSAASALILPICFDFTEDAEDEALIKKIIAIALIHPNENVRISAANGIRIYLWQRDPEFAQTCFINSIKSADWDLSKRLQNKNWFENANWDEEFDDLVGWVEKYCEQITDNPTIVNDLLKTIQTRNLQHLLIPCSMIPIGSVQLSHCSLLLQMVRFFIEAEESQSDWDYRKKKQIEVRYDLPGRFAERVADYLLELSNADIRRLYSEVLWDGCNRAPDLAHWIIMYAAVSADRTKRIDRYWNFWGLIKERIEKIALDLSITNSRSNDKNKGIRKIIEGMFRSYQPWAVPNVDPSDLVEGQRLIIEFARNAGSNADVFFNLAYLMYQYPEYFLQSGLEALAHHQKESGDKQLLSPNAANYLEQSINWFLLGDNSYPRSRDTYSSCLILLNALVENASSEGYFLRELLLRHQRFGNRIQAAT